MGNMSEKFFHKIVYGRNVYIDERFDKVKVLEIIEKFLYKNTDSRGYLPFGMTELAEKLDAQIFPYYPAVNVGIEHEYRKFTIYVTWDEEMLWRDVDKTTQKVYDVLRGIS